jgi:hypothetical protein
VNRIFFDEELALCATPKASDSDLSKDEEELLAPHW